MILAIACRQSYTGRVKSCGALACETRQALIGATVACLELPQSLGTFCLVPSLFEVMPLVHDRIALAKGDFIHGIATLAHRPFEPFTWPPDVKHAEAFLLIPKLKRLFESAAIAHCWR